MAGMAGRTAQVVGDGPYWGHTQRRTENMSHVPQAEVADIMGVRNAPWFEKWIHNKTENDYWARNAYNRYDKIRVPSLNFTGWFDANYPGSPQNYQGMRAKGGSPEARQPKLIIGPWPHGINRDRELEEIDYGSDSLIDLDGLICRWFDCWLKDVQPALSFESRSSSTQLISSVPPLLVSRVVVVVVSVSATTCGEIRMRAGMSNLYMILATY